MRRRAELEAATRLRITESAVELHGTLGPARTSVRAIAERAGVQRSTVYRHFPDEDALFAACSGHWRAANPPPDLGPWASIQDPEERLARALSELYAFYGRTEQMLANLLRDEDAVRPLRKSFAGFRGYLDTARDTLMAGRPGRGRAGARARAALGHALTFPVWRSLVREQGLDDAEAVALMCRMVAAAAQAVPSAAADAQKRR